MVPTFSFTGKQYLEFVMAFAGVVRRDLPNLEKLEHGEAFALSPESVAQLRTLLKRMAIERALEAERLAEAGGPPAPVIGLAEARKRLRTAS